MRDHYFESDTEMVLYKELQGVIAICDGRDRREQKGVVKVVCQRRTKARTADLRLCFVLFCCFFCILFVLCLNDSVIFGKSAFRGRKIRVQDHPRVT